VIVQVFRSIKVRINPKPTLALAESSGSEVVISGLVGDRIGISIKGVSALYVTTRARAAARRRPRWLVFTPVHRNNPCEELEVALGFLATLVAQQFRWLGKVHDELLSRIGHPQRKASAIDKPFGE
jgi:hypothetical protein